MDITNIAIATDKLTVTHADGTTADFTSPAAPAVPTQTVEVHAGEVVEVKGV